MSEPAQPSCALRQVNPFDTELLARLHLASFGETWDRPWSSQSFADILALPGSLGLIAHQQDTPIGFGLMLPSGEEVELLLLAVLPPWRRRGVAQRLLAALLRQAHRAGARRALLEAAAPNTAAIACYTATGFTVCGRRKDYYGAGIDAVIYELNLDSDSISDKREE
ncbi:MAG: GNAT family N-acetyltransferase [Rhodospirillaceae bacterium]|nr:GNAT family N-acetyltransferase [Rhodospirillaceae bacterium]